MVAPSAPVQAATAASTLPPLVWSSPHSLVGDGGGGGPAVQAISCLTPVFCVAGDNDGTIYTSDDPTGGQSSWKIADVDSNRSIEAISCPTTSLCVAADADGGIATSVDPTGGASDWKVRTVDGTSVIDAVSCPTTSLCVAAAADGNVLTSTDPTGGPSAWMVTNVEGYQPVALDSLSCASAAMCVAGDADGDVLFSTDPTGGVTAWHAAAVTGHAIDAMSCPSAGECVGGGAGGQFVTSADPTGGATNWDVSAIAGEPNDVVMGVSCPVTSFCAAVDQAGDVYTSTSPAGGAQSWVNEGPVGGAGPPSESVSCSSSSFCAAASDDVSVSTDPTGGHIDWTGWNLASTMSIWAMACPATSLCVAAGANAIATTTDPTGGSSTWKVAPVADSNILDALSCPTVKMCVALDDTGIYLSTDPTGGTGAWKAVASDGTGPFDDVSCASASRCLAVLDDGDVDTSTDPSTSWKETNIAGKIGLDAVSCPSVSFCVIVGAHQVMTSTDAFTKTPVWTTSELTGVNYFLSLSCPTTTECVATAAGPHYELVTSADPAGGAGAWTETVVGDGEQQLFAVSCPEADLCLAGDAAGDVISSTDPTDPSAWSVTNVDGPSRVLDIESVGCTGVTLCVAGAWNGDVLVGRPPLASSTSITSAGAGGVLGTPVPVKVKVSGPTNGSGATTPTGTVTVSDGVTSCVAGLWGSGGNAYATCDFVALDTGTFTLVASYSGDGRFASSAAPQTTTIEVTPAPSSAVLSLVGSSAYAGDPFAVATQMSGAPPGNTAAPTGLVTLDGGASPCQSALAGARVYSRTACDVTVAAPGTYDLTASYAGDSNFDPSTSPPLEVVVEQQPTTTALALSAPTVSSTDESTEVLTATVAGLYGQAAGNVFVTAGSTAVCDIVLLNGRGTCTLTDGELAAGSYTIVANYAGDLAMAASTSTAETLVVTS
jgi:hypothetical protein